ncbi:MAG: nuclear transport factor 2 family protein [Rhodobacteraceae bacterium]|nr:nuclear transport factor 2 family protein [Paracoccaceae bacterium]
MSTELELTVRDYFEALTAGNISAIVAMFAPDGRVHSPFLGVMVAKQFYAKLDEASANSELTVLDVLIGGDGKTVAAQFRYDWTLRSGEQIIFEGVDHFTFDSQGLITDMRIYYDTHPVREDVGDKYS